MSEAQILVVEDEFIVARDIQNRLKNMGYTVPSVTASGEEALDKVAQNRPDLVLMDIMLKGAMDGIAAAEKIRVQFNVPVIYLTAYSDESTLSRARISEPFGYLLKPFEERELHTTIEMALYKHKMEKRLKESEQWLSTTLKSIGDAVIATDRNGRVAFMNPVAETLTGWKQNDALGRELIEIFNVIDEKTRTHIESPSLRVLKGRSPIRLSYNIQLIARDGVETPIDDSASPIIDAKGNILGVVIAFRDITERRVAEEVLRQHAQYLIKRVKELHCLYGIFRILEKVSVTLEEILQQAVNLIPPAWQYPEATAARIVIRDQEFKTDNFRETPWRMAAEIHAFDEPVGEVEVCFLEQEPEKEEGPFLKEERSLINAIALQLGLAVERKTSESGLRQRIAELEHAYEDLKQSVEQHAS
jgi:PAS domain S-box-containing protein